MATQTTTRQRLHNHSRTYDLLKADGGWLTTAHIAMRLGIKEDSARRNLCRLERAGLVQRRVVPLAYRTTSPGYTRGRPSNTTTYDQRTEWRVT